MERKKGRSGSNRVSVHSNVSNQILLINSNVRKYFKKPHTNTMHCFENRGSLDGSSISMDEKFFLKKIEFTRFIGRLFPLNIIERQSKVWVNMNREYFFRSCE